MKTWKAAGLALFLSVLVHLLFFLMSYFVWMPGAAEMMEQTQKMFRVETVFQGPAALTRAESVRGYMEKMKFESPENRLEAGKSQHEIPEAALRPEPLKLDDVPTELSEMSQESLLKKAASEFKENKNIQTRAVVDKHAVKEMQIEKAWDDYLKAWDAEVDVPQEFADKMAGFTPTAWKQGTGFETAPAGPLFADLERTPGAEAIDEFLFTDVAVYQDPSDGEKYFRIAIVPYPSAEKLGTMPKEIIFLVDASLSIHRTRLNAFKQGISHSLQHLNPGDRFNIYTFKEDIKLFARGSVPATPDNIRLAMNFLDKLYASQRTDLYQAFLSSIKIPASTNPSYLVLLSDGKPNTGVTSPVKIISQITEINQSKRSIFAFSGGEKVNRFLLDFLAYQNRGWSEYSPEARSIAAGIANLYNKIRHPILTHIDFQISQLDDQEIYPKHLPDFYRDAAFLIFGKYQDSKPFSVRVTGYTDSQLKELVFARDLAEAPQGGPDIARQWALNKIYHLISRMTTEGYTQEGVAEVRQLSQKFGIETPYDM